MSRQSGSNTVVDPEDTFTNHRVDYVFQLASFGHGEANAAKLEPTAIGFKGMHLAKKLGLAASSHEYMGRQLNPPPAIPIAQLQPARFETRANQHRRRFAGSVDAES
ncbi:MAG: hypothetical protein MJE77_39340 [Proteobacteria bacterium]|nr:hypothetical protein [Pseudomonadota bacterium]